MMESWRTVFRAGVEFLSTPGLQSLRKALIEDSPFLLQEATTKPPPLQCVSDWPVEAACLIGFCGVIDHGGFSEPEAGGIEKNKDACTVADAEAFFAEWCFNVDQKLGEPAACRHLLNAYDSWPRATMRKELLPEVERALAEREAGYV